MPLILSALNVYPVKSCGGTAVASWDVDELGLKWDRRWMFVDGDNYFQTQRWNAALALVRPRLVDGGVELSAPGMPPLVAPGGGGPKVKTEVWGDAVDAESCGTDADQWASEYLGEGSRLVFLPDAAARRFPDGNGSIGRVGFADAFPFLLVGEASLEDLNRRLPDPIPMNRFRPNLVVSGSEPYAEDQWQHLTIGDIPFSMTTLCVRCAIPTIDQDTAVMSKEPSRTLATYRKTSEGVVFGVNLAHGATGRVEVGAPIAISAS
ncbi:MAG TPA: MOSC N-terminal beta barrel domain-containing protein [Gemmatimonadales bacterium]|nr:MOSC N-terminal beta barrel domain-containing protein [Gemmatimonadales bacterium]